jgi:hypothetical protein
MTECARCGEEVRFGEREGREGWWHRTRMDHIAILGTPLLPEDHPEIQAALDAPRVDAKGEPYTTRGFDIAKIKDRAKREAAEQEAAEATDEEWEEHEIPAPEVLSTPIELRDTRLPGGAKQIWNLCLKNGWTCKGFYSRGPRVHKSQGRVLSISDYVVLKMVLDGGTRRAVGSWEDNSFDFGYILDVDRKTNTASPLRVNSAAVKAWIKGETT